MQFYDVLIIGKGTWGTKLNEILQRDCPTLNITSISARELLSDINRNYLLLENSSLVWIATTPEVQLKLLKLLNNFQIKVILEKPSFLTKSQFEELILQINNKTEVFMSEPWKYSSTWQFTKQLIKEKKPTNIKVRRGSELVRNNIPSWLDWCFHDLSLIYDLNSINSLESDLIIKNSCAEINIWTNEYELDLVCGLMPRKIATWEFNDVIIDFNASSYSQGNKRNVLEMNMPLANQLTFCLKAESNIQELEAKLMFYYKVIEKGFFY